MKVSWSSLIVVATFSSVAGSAVVSVFWFTVMSGSSRFEPAVETLGLVAGLTGILAERLASARERRRLVISGLVDEFRKSASILDDPRFAPRTGEAVRPQVYPRLPVSAIDFAMTSGVLANRRDAELLRRLHTWRDEVNGFNRRLDLTELRTFAAGLEQEVGEFERALHRDGGYLSQLRRHVHDLLTYLPQVHAPAPGPSPRPGIHPLTPDLAS